MTTTVRPPIATSGEAATVQRPEIQALRAVAVLAVVLFHLWPTRITGGYVGVDVFFVISGFLIIGHLLREVDRTGTIRLLRFWARRIRRLLPAALSVLAVTAIVVIIWIPQVWWPQFLGEVGASAAYVVNWLLAANSVDYLGSENAPSPAQHYWSLSVEEQFYVVFPLLILLAVAVCRARRWPMRTAIGVVLVVVVVASFAFSALAVAAGDPAAYFVTHSRAWQFAIGGLLAFSASKLSGSIALRAAASWLGLGLILGSVLLFTATTPFPGVMALVPTVGTLLVIWAGMPAARWAPTRALGLRPVQFLGDISYSTYLWHWPPIVILPIVLARELGTVERLGLVVATLAAAWLTKRFIEEPFRYDHWIVRRLPRASVAALLCFSLLIAAGSGALAFRASQQAAAAEQAIAEAVRTADPCIGAPAAVNDCERPFAADALTNPAFAATDIGRGVQVEDDCKQTMDDVEIMRCVAGDPDASVTIALVGDSHAGQYLEALDVYGKQHAIRFVSYLKTWCTGTGATNVAAEGSSGGTGMESCTAWGDAVLDELAADPTVSAVVYAAYSAAYLGNSLSATARSITAADYASAWSRLVDAGKRVIALRDIPTAAVSIPECVAVHLDDYDPCATPESAALLAPDVDPMMVAAASTAGVTLVDLSDVFCSDDVCHSLIGGIIVYFGNHHMTATFARTIAPIVGDRIMQAVG